jgi:hypothetical protein
MGTIRTLVVTTPYEAVTDDISYLLVRCEARPLTAGLAVALQALLSDIGTTADDEGKLALEVLRAEALVETCDEDIDVTVDAVVNTVLTITGGDRSSDLYVHFVGGSTPAALKEPRLGAELDTVRTWVPSLQASPHPGLVALAPVLAAQVAAADQAVAKLVAARQALKDFREVGERPALIDKVNAARKAAYGELGVIAHTNPQANLPKDFADRFFMRDPKVRKKPTSKELQVKLDAAKAVVADLTGRLAATKADEQAAADALAAQKEKEHQAELEAAKKKAAAAAAKVAALEKPGDP